MTEPDRGRRTLEVAAEIAALLEADGARVALIGATALAVHGYVRATRDLDLATVVEPFTQLRALAGRCRAAGHEVELSYPDEDDPLGGVMTVTGADFDPIQVVNFYNPLRDTDNPGFDAVTEALPGLIEGSALRVARIVDLVALKLYAGGAKSLADAVELLRAQDAFEEPALRRACAQYGLEPALELVLRELR
ncbi:MAG: hypothetical protein HY908_28560 [Myxococcales bacterium]|nr:hypothetical protein [Myxococcales bacterium]